jgi:two-component system response regulator HydG
MSLPQVAAGASGRVMLVDDDRDMCETLSRWLVRRGFAVAWRTSAPEALALLDGEDFDVVVTDLNMDGMDGLALCERATALRPGLPVIVTTAFGTAEIQVAATAAGAYDFMTKPFDLEALRLALHRAVAARK